jgi:MscS family membrane protein
MDNLANIWTNGLEFLQPYPWLQAFGVIIIFSVLAWLADRVISGIITRLVSKTQTNVDDQLVRILHRPVFSSVAIIGLVLATYRIGLAEPLQLSVIAIIKSLLILIWLIFGLRLSRIILSAMRRHRRFEMVQQTTEPLLTNAAAVLIFIAGAYAILVAWNINVTGLVASAGIVGLALSFAAQDTLSNLFAGVAILADSPYKIGDFIILDSGERGQVTHIGLRSTRLLTRDDVEISIPNGVMGSAKIINEAGGPPRRFRIKVSVGVSYGSDIDQVMAVLLDVAANHKKVFVTPEPRARFRQFGDSSLDFDLLCWIAQPVDRGLVVHDLNCAIYKNFAAADITIPFPQRDLYIKQMP